jgi:hypothetical protein
MAVAGPDGRGSRCSGIVAPSRSLRRPRGWRRLANKSRPAGRPAQGLSDVGRDLCVGECDVFGIGIGDGSARQPGARTTTGRPHDNRARAQRSLPGNTIQIPNRTAQPQPPPGTLPNDHHADLLAAGRCFESKQIATGGDARAIDLHAVSPFRFLSLGHYADLLSRRRIECKARLSGDR